MSFHRAPLGQKQVPAVSRPDYLDAVRSMPCWICSEFGGGPQMSRTEAHHPICGRFSQRKVADTQAIPLCTDHHTGFGFAPDRVAIHKDRAEWVLHYGQDTDWIARTQNQLAHLLGGPTND